MAERRVLNGVIYERGADGVVRRVGNASGPAPKPTYNLEAPKMQGEIDRTAASIQNDNARLAIQQRDLALKEEAAARQRRALPLTPGQQTLDTEFAKEYASWVPGGGSTQVSKNIGLMARQVPKLQNSDTITGAVIGRLPEFMQQAINPDSINVRQNVERAIQASLKETLGSAFTEEEAKQLLARSYNPKADEAENVERTQVGIDELRDLAWAKDDASRYFGRTGTLVGHGPSPRPRDNQQALSYGEKQLADMIRERGFNEAQANAARQKFYADPRVSKLRNAPRVPRKPSGGLPDDIKRKYGID